MQRPMKWVVATSEPACPFQALVWNFGSAELANRTPVFRAKNRITALNVVRNVNFIATGQVAAFSTRPLIPWSSRAPAVWSAVVKQAGERGRRMIAPCRNAFLERTASCGWISGTLELYVKVGSIFSRTCGTGDCHEAQHNSYAEQKSQRPNCVTSTGSMVICRGFIHNGDLGILLVLITGHRCK